MGKIQINLANPQELLEILAEFAAVVGSDLTLTELAEIDFAPAGDSATESAGG